MANVNAIVVKALKPGEWKISGTLGNSGTPTTWTHNLNRNLILSHYEATDAVFQTEHTTTTVLLDTAVDNNVVVTAYFKEIADA